MNIMFPRGLYISVINMEEKQTEIREKAALLNVNELGGLLVTHHSVMK